MESGVSYLNSRVKSIVEASNGHSLVACDRDIIVPCRYDGIILQCRFLVMVFMKTMFLFFFFFFDSTSIIPCFKLLTWYYRLATVASGAASGKLLQYEVGGPKVSVQTAYGVEVEVGTIFAISNTLMLLLRKRTKK